MERDDLVYTGETVKKLARQKLGWLLDWEPPKTIKTVGPFDENAFDAFNRDRLFFIDEINLFLSRISMADIGLLVDVSIDDPHNKREAWRWLHEPEISRLKKREPAWFDAGFGNPDHEADFEYWGRMAGFFIDEALCLSIGIEPNEFDRDLLKGIKQAYEKGKVKSKPLVFLVRRLELLSRAFQVEAQFNTKIDRNELLMWFMEIDLDVPPRFIEEASKYSGSPKSIGREDSSTAKPMTRLEKESLLKMIAGMACEQYGYDPNAERSDATTNIRNDLELIGLSLDRKTIKKWLDEAAALVDPSYWEADK